MTGDRCFETIRVLVQIIDFVDKDTLFPLSIEKADVLLCAIEMQATDRLAVVVIKKNPAITVDIADGDALRRHDFAQNGPDDPGRCGTAPIHLQWCQRLHPCVQAGKYPS